MVKAWIHCHGKEAENGRSDMSRALARTGVAVDSINSGESTGPGLVIFNDVDEELCGVLRPLSDHGRRRVLAIALNPPALANGKAWLALDAGASDCICWHDTGYVPQYIAARLERWAVVDELLESPLVHRNLVGDSAAWISTLRRVIEVAHFTDAPVLILGESGTGKELAARLIHTLDPRPSKGELVVVDCTTITPDLAGSEFFGHERGSFTGAVGPRDGAFALADGGTLFLDEVGELPLRLQAQLLRVLQEHAYRRVGGNKWHRTDFRLVCATNRDLKGDVSAGQFRGDLYFRIANWVFRLPSLRERPGDILPLARHFLRRRRADDEPLDLDDAVQAYLLAREYPGNVRELEHLVSRISQIHVGDGPVSIGDIPQDERPGEGTLEPDWRDAQFERALRRALLLGARLKDLSDYTRETAIHLAVSSENGNLQRAARKLGVTDRTLQMRRANQQI